MVNMPPVRERGKQASKQASSSSLILQCAICSFYFPIEEERKLAKSGFSSSVDRLPLFLRSQKRRNDDDDDDDRRRRRGRGSQWIETEILEPSE